MLHTVLHTAQLNATSSSRDLLLGAKGSRECYRQMGVNTLRDGAYLFRTSVFKLGQDNNALEFCNTGSAGGITTTTTEYQPAFKTHSLEYNRTLVQILIRIQSEDTEKEIKICKTTIAK